MPRKISRRSMLAMPAVLLLPAGKVFAHKLIIGDIAIERANQIVTIAPRKRNIRIAF